MKKLFAWIAGIVILAGVIYGGGKIWNAVFKDESIITYSSQKVKQGNMRRTISSTGTVEPEELVNVGAQIGGMITKFGTDANGGPIDYGSIVKADSVLATIDDSLYTAERDFAQANVLQAEASIASAEANLEQAKAKLKLAESNWKRAQSLMNVNARNEYDTALSEYGSAKAAEELAEANLKQAKAQLASAKASLVKATHNLEYCTIFSPVDGVIIDRRVNIGQTVNASMNAPSLFLIARDLRRMQVWVSVNEADVGEIKPGGKVEFTVDAFPGRTFRGTVKKTRLNATMSQNVVTYVVEIETDNSDGTLLPYLTANVKFILEERENVRMAPNAAFRFTPPENSGLSIPQTAPGEKIVWVKAGKTIRPVAVKTGLNDGAFTEILSGDLPADADVVTGSRTVLRSEAKNTPAAQDGGTNPFLPKMPSRPGTKKQGGEK